MLKHLTAATTVCLNETLPSCRHQVPDFSATPDKLLPGLWKLPLKPHALEQTQKLKMKLKAKFHPPTHLIPLCETSETCTHVEYQIILKGLDIARQK